MEDVSIFGSWVYTFKKYFYPAYNTGVLFKNIQRFAVSS